MPAAQSSLCGIVLAAGAGTRYGGPKALARMADGTPWVERAVEVLEEAGCDVVLVALGARRAEAALIVPAGALIVPVDNWADGMSASLRAALAAAAATSATAAVVVPVDTPGMPASVVRRVLSAAAPTTSRSTMLVRAVYDGRPGHPVVIGRAHWDAAAAGLRADRGAADYLRGQGATAVECRDLWDGRDTDHR